MELVEMMSLDLHKSKKYYSNLCAKIEAEKPSKKRDILLKYIEWHNKKLEKGNLEQSSIKRSVEIAYSFLDKCPLALEHDINAVKQWWLDYAENKERSALQKTSSQVKKFLKFRDFSETGEDMRFFNNKVAPTSKEAMFFIMDEAPRKQFEKPRISQEQIKQVLDELLKGNKASILTCALVSLLNDTGARFSEIATLRNKDIVLEEDYLVITIQQSKTRTRTVISALSKKYLNAWLSISPNRNNSDALLFCNEKKNPLNYNIVLRKFKKTLETCKVSWAKGSSFHYLRHLFASRTNQWDGDLLSYWLGWSMKNKMRERYSSWTYKACIKQYYSMLEEEKNPMLNMSLTFIDKQKEDEYKTRLIQDIEPLIQAYLEKKNLKSLT